VLPDNHPLKVADQDLESPSSPFSPVSLGHNLAEQQLDTVQLLGGLRDLESEQQDVCVRLDFDLLSDSQPLSWVSIILVFHLSLHSNDLRKHIVSPLKLLSPCFVYHS
jgi:hypothetical protein